LSKRSKRKVGRVVKRTLADGTIKEYRYGAYKAAPGRISADSLDALIRAYKRSPEWTALRPRSKENYSGCLRNLEEIGQTAVRSIARRDILSIRNAIASARGPGSANAFARAASVLFAWAVDQEWVAFSPVHRVKPLPGGSLPAWTAEQANNALRGLPEHLRRAAVLGLYTGQRRGDLCAVKWAAYDGQTIVFVQEKTGVEVVLRVVPNLKAELDQWDRAADTILVNARGKPWSRPNGLSTMMSEELQKVGLPKGLNVHGMRKLFAAGMADNGATTHEIAASTGHQTLSMVQLYTRSVERKKLAEGAVGKIQTFTNSKQTTDNIEK
jgi:integrase